VYFLSIGDQGGKSSWCFWSARGNFRAGTSEGEILVAEAIVEQLVINHCMDVGLLLLGQFIGRNSCQNPEQGILAVFRRISSGLICDSESATVVDFNQMVISENGCVSDILYQDEFRCITSAVGRKQNNIPGTVSSAGRKARPVLFPFARKFS
jgi:hypothetical protein